MSGNDGGRLRADLHSRRLRPFVLAVALLRTVGGCLMLSSYFISDSPRPITVIGGAFLLASIVPWTIWSRDRRP